MEQHYSADYIRLFTFSLIVSLIAYGFPLTNFTFTIDTEMSWDPNISLPLGRWGTNLFRHHIFNGITPYFTLLFSLIMLSLAAVEISKLFNFTKVLGYIFCCIFLTFPQMAYQLVFTMQADVVAVGFLLSAFIVKFFIMSSTGKFTLRSALYFSVAALLYMFTIGLYQALIFIPIVLYMVVFFQRTYLDDYNFASEFKKGLLFVGLVIAGCILYFISVKIIYPQATNALFAAPYTSGESQDRLTNFYNIWKSHLKGDAFYGSKTFIIASICAVVLFIMLLFKKGINKFISIVVLVLLMLVPFLISFPITSGYHPPRLYITSGIVLAFLLVHLFSKLPFGKGPIAITGIVVLMNIYFITMLFWSQQRIYEHDINLAKRIDFQINQKYPEFDPQSDYIYFFGGLPFSEHDRFRLPKSEVFGGSFFMWDNGSNYRINSFFRFTDSGYYKVIDKEEVYLKAKDSVHTMPAYPKEGYIKKVDNVMIVKLGDTEGAPLWF